MSGNLLSEFSNTNEKEKILIADDEPSLRILLETLLSEAGFETMGAENGAECLKVAQSFLPDLIILDVYMPIMDGFQTAEELRKIKALSKIPIVFLTGASTPESLRAGFEAGGDEYLYKPINSEELLIRINALLRMHRAELEADRLTRNFQYLLVQDFINYSTAVQVPLLLLKDEFAGSLNDEQKEILEIATKALDEHIKLLQESAEVVKFDPQNILLKRSKFNIIENIRQNISDLNGIILAKKIIVNEKFHTDDLLVEFDQVQFSQALRLLINHAISHTPENGKIAIYLNDVFENEQKCLMLSVEDGGEPIDTEELNLIVDRFEQARMNKVVMDKNLSLTLCKMIIEAHGGKFWAENTGTVGNSYICKIPLVQFN